MQFPGGYQYPGGRICALLTTGAVLIAVLVWWVKSLSVLVGVALFLGLEGTALIASSYTPVGLSPPSGNFVKQFLWAIKPQKGTSVSFNQPMFFGGLFCLWLSYVTTALSG